MNLISSIGQLVIIVDGMLSGTGVRDALNGGYLKPACIGLSEIAERRIGEWLSRYSQAHLDQYCHSDENAALDREGIEIAEMIARELPEAKVRYFSNALMKDLSRSPQ